MKDQKGMVLDRIDYGMMGYKTEIRTVWRDGSRK
jgi:hypothetical protein